MQYMNIIGLRVRAVKGYRWHVPSDRVHARFVLFDDGKTYFEFGPLDIYAEKESLSCNTKEVILREDQARWKKLMELPDANHDLESY